jgi:hypothetical protein
MMPHPYDGERSKSVFFPGNTFSGLISAIQWQNKEGEHCEQSKNAKA